MLYVLAAQPLAARLRQLQAAGVVDGILMPDGSLAPPCHQHADDTSLHTATVHGAAAAMEHAVVPFGAASNARLSLPKCVGMLLGPGADQVHGVEPVTQVPFVAPAEHVRHLLGILISAGDQPAATRAMFAKRLTAVRLHVRCWARFSLSYLGRLHIAKQVLASSIYYHASFMLPPADLLAELVQCIDRFVVQGHWDDGPVPPLPNVPSVTVECLPWEAGGLNRVDVAAQMHGLQAKVAALLLHPRRHTWKVLMRAALARQVPGLGHAALVSQLQPRCTNGRLLRHVDYWKALRKLRPHRSLPAGELPGLHALHEQMASNCQLATDACSSGLLASGARLKRFAAERQLQPGQALAMHHLHTDALPGEGPARLLGGRLARLVGPAPWRALLQGGAPVPEPEWLVSDCGRFARRDAQGDAFAVRSDGRLDGLADEEVQLPAGGWRPACVCWCPVLKGQQLLVELEAPPYMQPAEAASVAPPGGKVALQPYVLGLWAGVIVDPNMWQVGRMHLSHYTVKDAALRLRLLRRRAADAEFTVAAGHRPRLWADPSGRAGLAGLEAGWAAALHDRWLQLKGARQPRAARSSGAITAGVAADTAPRVHPLQRAAAAGRAVAGRRLDEVDVLVADAILAPGLAAPPWRKAYEALKDRRLDRVTRHFGWRLLHGALRCGAASVLWCAAESEQGLWDSVCCRQQACAAAASLPGGCVVPALADFSHTFLHCPAARLAVQWLCDVWARIAPADSPVPVDARVLLLGDLDVWLPSGGYGPESLWLHLRLLLCRAVWLLACKARAGEPVTWQGAVAVARAWVSRAIRQDWLRVSDTLPGTEVLPSWCVIDKRYQLTQEQFQARWCLNDVLAHIDQPAAGSFALYVHVPGCR